MKTIKSDGSFYHYGAKRRDYLYDRINQELKCTQNELKRAQKENEELKKLIKELLKKNEKLLSEIERLTSIISNNSKNSSLPPSSDQKPGTPKSPNEYNSRKKTNRRPGGQVGRHGTNITKQDIERKIAAGLIKHRIINCGNMDVKDGPIFLNISWI